MKSGIVLVVSASLSNDDLCSSPFNLHPEEFFLASYDSLCFLGFSRFCLVILHEPDPDICTKLSLGIRDSRLLEGMWNLVALSNSPVRIISSPKNRPLKSLLDLGVEPFSPSEVRDFLSSLSSPKNSASFNPKKQPLLTADDIREMHKMGKLRLEPGALLTEWAKEVAVTLGISLPEKQANFVLAFLSTPTRASLIDLSEKIHSWSRANPKLLFVVPSPQIPLFRELFPSISSRLVAPAFHWAESGAFTGEVSLGMIQDAGCFGAIMPHSKPFFTKEQILQIASHWSILIDN
ncbi:triose-phosphate isomerase [bacterium]|nr:triose-phosphate isomerase [bacterium]